MRTRLVGRRHYSACVGLSAPPQATQRARICMPTSFTPAAAPDVLFFFVFFHPRRVILSRSIVQRPCFGRETSLYQCHHPAQLVASRGYLIQTAEPLKTARGSSPNAFLNRCDSVCWSLVLNTIAFSRHVQYSKYRDVSFFETCSLSEACFYKLFDRLS